MPVEIKEEETQDDTQDTSYVEPSENIAVLVLEKRDQLDGHDLDQGQSVDEPDALKIYYFDFNRALLNSAAQDALKHHAKHIRDNNLRVLIEGHTDERGSREYNIALGDQRAKAVKRFLIGQRVNPRLIRTVSYGEERPAQGGNNEIAWSHNRRAVLIYQ